MFVLLFSANPFIGILGSASTIVALILTIFLLRGRIRDYKALLSLYIPIFGFLIVIFLFQKVALGFVSWPGAMNFVAKIFVGGLIIFTFRDKFNVYFFKLIYWLSCISLIGYVLINLLGIPFPGLETAPTRYSYFFYGTSGIHIHQNQGMFWEPGAFAGIITLCLALNFNNLKYYWLYQRFQLLVVIGALLTTFSTTGYLSFFVLLFFYILGTKQRNYAMLLLPVIISTAVFVYQDTDFLKNKIETQLNAAAGQEEGEYSNTRFGSLVFDWHYITKHPIIGNGLSEQTRYADHPWLIALAEKGENLGNGNGFSSFLASMGCLFMLSYFILMYKALSFEGKYYAIVVSIIVLLNLQGEQWFNHLIYLGIPFINLLARKGLLNPDRHKVNKKLKYRMAAI